VSNILLIQENKKARFDYSIIETYEAGLVLIGSEVKSLRNKDVQLKDAYIVFQGNEAFLQNAHIAEYKASSYKNPTTNARPSRSATSLIKFDQVCDDLGRLHGLFDSQAGSFCMQETFPSSISFAILWINGELF